MLRVGNLSSALRAELESEDFIEVAENLAVVRRFSGSVHCGRSHRRCRRTIYRYFPTRADLIVAVYRHQVEACAEAGPALLRDSSSAFSALAQWIDLFVDFLVTKHGIASALQSQSAAFETLPASFIERLLPVCAQLLEAASAAKEIAPDIDAYGLMRGIRNVCIGADTDPNYDARRMVHLIIAGLRSQ